MKWLLVTLSFTLLMLTLEAQKLILPKPSDNDTAVYDKNQLNRLPRFPGGKKAFYEFLNKNINWPDQIDGQGIVTVGFVVERDGHLTNINVVKGGVPEFNAEALRVIRKSPKWIPGIKNGKTIRVKYSVPINFTLTD
jgi:periplasmic protein TonB